MFPVVLVQFPVPVPAKSSCSESAIALGPAYNDFDYNEQIPFASESLTTIFKKSLVAENTRFQRRDFNIVKYSL